MTSTARTPIFLNDTLSGSRQELRTISEGKCGIYCCGPTVYGLTHVGNARAAVVPDVIVRFLRHEGYEVRYVRNITDIDDKIIARAAEDGTSADEVARHFAEEYHQDLADFNMLEPDVEPKVSDHIAEIIAIISTLIDRELAYVVDGDVYYRVSGFKSYGKLSKRTLEEMLEGAGSRVEVDQRKETPLDFALWKSSKPGEPAWDSPWGPGRPGWHIECSAMSSTHLGDSFDIHCGGRDLIFPHHENEIAQSQGAHGDGTFARYWIHNGFINFDGEKMSKSLGNFFTTRQVRELYDGETIRYFLLTVHYSSGLNFSVEVSCPECGRSLSRGEQESGNCAECGHRSDPELLKQRVRFPGLEDAEDRLSYIYGTLQQAVRFLVTAKAPQGDGAALEIVAGMTEAFAEHMRNDFNTGGALGTLSKPLAEVNKLLASGKGVAKDLRYRTIAVFVDRMQDVARILGCCGQDPDTWLARRRDRKAARIGLDIERVEALLAERTAARQEKDWARSDELRDVLLAMGVAVKDGPEGSTWDFC